MRQFARRLRVVYLDKHTTVWAVDGQMDRVDFWFHDNLAGATAIVHDTAVASNGGCLAANFARN